MRDSNRTAQLLRFLKYMVLLLMGAFCLYPILWLLLTSFKTNDELFLNPWGMPALFRLENYWQAIEQGHILQYFGNSVVVAVSAVLVCVLCSAMASFAIARMHWKSATLVYYFFLLGMMIPIYAMIIPMFVMLKQMGLLNHHLSVIVPQIAIGFPTGVFIITGFMRSIPTELEEAAVIDGSGVLHIFTRIILPICRSSIVTVAVVLFIGCWNDLLLPQIFLTDAKKMTLPVGLTEFKGRYSTNYVTMVAAVVITVVPSIVVYAFLHKNIMEGMVAGAVKG